jgi:hypothetical protein
VETNSYTLGLTKEQIEKQIPLLEAQLVNCHREDNCIATQRHLNALREALKP